MKILGVNLSHNLSVCLLEDGKIKSFKHEERFCKHKNMRAEIGTTNNFITMNEHINLVNINVANEAVSVLVRLLAPFAPHLSEELWKKLEGKESVHLSSWPTYSTKALEVETINLVIQIKDHLFFQPIFLQTYQKD